MLFKDIDELNELKSIFNKNPVFLVKIPSMDNYKFVMPISSNLSTSPAQATLAPPSSLQTSMSTPSLNNPFNSSDYNRFIELLQLRKQFNLNILKYLHQNSINQTNQLINNNLAIFKP